ncbi:MAG: hypothetical protein B7X68_08930 [Sphingobacteriia bacterium 39-36-14]|nr:MAG: hypothetical protein B7X68_08930 [Sphingobacteriia bacterium 39-36-14]
MRQKLAFESMKMGNPSSTKGAAGNLGKPPYLEVGERSEPTILLKDWCETERANNPRQYITYIKIFINSRIQPKCINHKDF